MGQLPPPRVSFPQPLRKSVPPSLSLVSRPVQNLDGPVRGARICLIIAGACALIQPIILVPIGGPLLSVSAATSITDALISTAAILVAFRDFSNECSGKGCVGASCVVVTGNPSEQEIIRSTR
jgi:hypothetical protein